MPASSILSIAALAGLLSLVPGLDTALVLRWAIAIGRRQAFASAFGFSTGVWIWGAAASVGIAAVLTASELAYTLLQLGGAAYLLWLGATLLVAAWRRRTPGGAAGDRLLHAEVAAGAGRAWARGLTTNLLNPKVGVFYMAVLPQFIPVSSAHHPLGLLLATVHNAEGLLWFSVLITGVHAVRRWAASRAFRRAVDTVTGCTLLAFGATMALARR